MIEKNRSPPLSGGTSTEAIEPTILFQKGQVHLYGIKIRYPQHGKDIRQLGVCRMIIPGISEPPVQTLRVLPQLSVSFGLHIH